MLEDVISTLRQEKNGIQIEGESKRSLFANNMIIYVEYAIKSTKDIEGLVNCRNQYEYAYIS